MKKLKVILPAILTLAVSTSAAVTGTVAWFTATRLRTVNMNNVTVVDPTEGLILSNVTALKNVTLSNVDNTGAPEANKIPGIRHASYKDGEDVVDGYLRDASVDVNGGKVWRADVNDDESIGGYSDVSSVTDWADTATYSNKKVWFATSYSLTFKVSEEQTAYNQSLFLDLNQSTATKPDRGEAATSNLALYNAVRFGFKQGDEWVVWAPYTRVSTTAAEYVEETVADADDFEAKKSYLYSDTNGTAVLPDAVYSGSATYYKLNPLKARYVSSTSALTPYAAANFVTGHETGTSTDNSLDDSEHYVSVDDRNAYPGYLGNLNKTTGITITCYVWFEGTDPDCISSNFTEALAGLSTSLKFIMRRTATA